MGLGTGRTHQFLTNISINPIPLWGPRLGTDNAHKIGLSPPRFSTLRRPCAIGQASFWAERRFFCTLLWVNLLLVNWGLPEVCILTPFPGPSEPGAGGGGDCPPSRFWQIQYPIHNQRGRLRPLDFQTFLRPCLGHSKRGSSISLKYDFLLTL